MKRKSPDPSAFQCFKHYLTLVCQYAQKKFKKFTEYSVLNMDSEAVKIKPNDISHAKKTYQGLQISFFYDQYKENKGDKQAIVTICICLEKALEAVTTNSESQSTEGNLETIEIETIEKEAQERLDQFHKKYNSILRELDSAVLQILANVPDTSDIESPKIGTLIASVKQHATKIQDTLKNFDSNDTLLDKWDRLKPASNQLNGLIKELLQEDCDKEEELNENKLKEGIESIGERVDSIALLDKELFKISDLRVLEFQKDFTTENIYDESESAEESDVTENPTDQGTTQASNSGSESPELKVLKVNTQHSLPTKSRDSSASPAPLSTQDTTGLRGRVTSMSQDELSSNSEEEKTVTDDVESSEESEHDAVLFVLGAAGFVAGGLACEFHKSAGDLFNGFAPNIHSPSFYWQATGGVLCVLGVVLGIIAGCLTDRQCATNQDVQTPTYSV
jgi:hypothetical protein